MQYLRRQISKHGFAAEMAAIFVSMLVLGLLLMDAIYAGSDGVRVIRDVVLSLIIGTLVVGTALAVGEPDPPVAGDES